MRVDAYTHFIPKKFFEAVEKIPGAGTDIGKRMRGVPCIYDLDERRRIVGLFPDYAQILSYPMPPPESFVSGAQLDDLIRLTNDGFADIVRQHPDQFPGFVAQVSLASPDRGGPGSPARDPGSGCLRGTNLHQRQWHADRPAAIRRVLVRDGRTRQAGVDASGPLCQPARLRG